MTTPELMPEPKLQCFRVTPTIKEKVAAVIADGGRSESELVECVRRKMLKCPHVCGCKKHQPQTDDNATPERRTERVWFRVRPAIDSDEMDNLRACFECIITAVKIRPVVYSPEDAAEINKWHGVVRTTDGV